MSWSFNQNAANVAAMEAFVDDYAGANPKAIHSSHVAMIKAQLAALDKDRPCAVLGYGSVDQPGNAGGADLPADVEGPQPGTTFNCKVFSYGGQP